MTVTVSLTKEQEIRLSTVAQQRGVNTNTLVSEILNNAIDQYSMPVQTQSIVSSVCIMDVDGLVTILMLLSLITFG